MSLQEILSLRLQSHGLLKPLFCDPAEMIQHYGCIQAQDIPQATRVIGSRLKKSNVSEVKQACKNGSIVRTWPMRGTLHYMAPQNVHRMLDLCASKTLPGFTKRREFLGISDKHADKALQIMDNALRGGKSLTRTQLGEVLKEKGIPMQTQRVYHLACYAATRKLICFGPPTEKEETFVLLDEWVKKPLRLSQEEQLAELARMYVRGHGPCTVDDLARWCALSKTECKKAISLVEKEFETIINEGKTYYFVPQKKSTLSSGIQLLGGFDEYFIGYKDRSIVADTAHYEKMFTKNGIFFPLVLQDGRVVGSWKRVWKKDTAQITLDLLPKVKIDKKIIQDKAEQFAAFWGYKGVILSGI